MNQYAKNAARRKTKYVTLTNFIKEEWKSGKRKSTDFATLAHPSGRAWRKHSVFC
jgi:hypothetical protein